MCKLFRLAQKEGKSWTGVSQNVVKFACKLQDHHCSLARDKYKGAEFTTRYKRLERKKPSR